MTNEASGYQATLEEFARGKRLARLAKYVRARSDDRCDACGSTLPRLLFGLKDVQTDRCHFVGQNCLSWLLDNGLVARARFRQSSETAYEREMKLRLNGESGRPINPEELNDRAPVEMLPPLAAESQTNETGLVMEGRWVRQDGGFVFEPPATDMDRLLVLIAISRVAIASNGSRRDGG
jgi:hypothetical protein